MPVKRLKHEYALPKDRGQQHNGHLAAIAGVEQFAGCFGMFLMILNQIADDEVGIDKLPLLAACLASPGRLRGGSRISAKAIPFPFLLASTPFSDRIPGWTRMVARSPSTSYSSLSPGLIRNARRIFSGMVVCP